MERSERKKLSTRKSRFTERQQRQRKHLESHTNTQTGKIDVGGSQAEARDHVESAEIQEQEKQEEDVVVSGDDMGREGLELKHAAEGDSSVDDGNFAERYARATFDLQGMMKQKLKKPEEVRREFDERLYAQSQQNTEVDLRDLSEVRKLLADVVLVSKKIGAEVAAYNFTDEELRVVSEYLRAKNAFDVMTDENLTEVREKLEDGDSEGDVETALDAIRTFENNLMDEEIRLRNNIKGESELLAKVKRKWKWLGDKNLAIWLSDEKGYQPKNTFWGKVGYGVLRAASLRTALMGSLVPVAGFGFGAAGIAAALGVKRGVGAFFGASAGHTFAQAWLERGLKKEIDEISTLKTFKEKDYERAVHLKKEYDAFIQQYHSDTAEEIRSGVEYKNIQDSYREAIKFFCEDATGVENVRMKQNLSEVRARNIVKKNKLLLFGSAALGGAVSALVAPKVFDMASDLVDGADVPTDEPKSTYKKPIAKGRAAIPAGSLDIEQGSAVDSPAVSVDTRPAAVQGEPERVMDIDDVEEQEVPLSPQDGDFEVVSEEGENTPLPESAGEVEDAVSEGSAIDDGEFLVGEQGVYTVQDGNWLSKIWLDKNDGDRGQMLKVVEALRDLQDTEEGVEKLKDFGIRSGDIEILYPGDEIKTDAIQEWFDADISKTSVDTQSTAVQNESEQVTDIDAIEEEVSPPASEGGVATDPTDEKEVSLPVSEGKTDVKEVPISISDGDLDTDSVGTTGRRLEDMKVFEEIIHTVHDEGTVADVLQSHGFDAGAIPQNILEKQVFEGHDVQIFTTKEGDFAGITVDGEYLSSGQWGIASSEVHAEAFEEIIHTVHDEGTVADVLQSHGFDAGAIPQNILEKQVFEGHDVQIFTTKEGDFAGITVDGEYLSSGQMSVGEKRPFTDTLEDLVKTAEALNADMKDVHNHIIIARTDGVPILPATDLQQFRPDLFESDQSIASSIVKGDDSVLVQVDHPLQKRFLIETNQEGNLNHDHVQKEFATIQKTLQKPESIHSARQEVIRKSLQALTVEKPPVDATLFDTLADRLSVKIEGDTDLTERMFSEKGWGDRRVRIAYSEDQGHLEVQERLNVNKGRRYRQAKWEWKSILVEKITNKK